MGRGYPTVITLVVDPGRSGSTEPPGRTERDRHDCAARRSSHQTRQVLIPVEGLVRARRGNDAPRLLPALPTAGGPDESVWPTRSIAESADATASSSSMTSPRARSPRSRTRWSGDWPCPARVSRTLRGRSSAALAARRRLAGRGGLDDGVRPREEETLMAIRPMHQVRRSAVVTAHLDDLAVAALVAYTLPSNADAVPYGCFHDASSLSRNGDRKSVV